MKVAVNLSKVRIKQLSNRLKTNALTNHTCAPRFIYECGLTKGGDVTSFRSEPTVNLSTTSFYNKLGMAYDYKTIIADTLLLASMRFDSSLATQPKYKVNSKSMAMWEVRWRVDEMRLGKY